MPRIKQMTPQQIAGYYCNAHGRDSNINRYVSALNNLIESVASQLRDAENESPEHEALDHLHQVLSGLKNESKSAAQARRSGDDAAGQAHENQAAAFAGQIKDAVRQVNRLDDVQEISLSGFEAEAQIKSPMEWIRDAREDFNNPSTDRDMQIARGSAMT